MDGVINIFKNKGMSSFDVVRRVKFIAKQKKVGHTGTLDPEATGVLPVCLGKATKIIDYIMNTSKVYEVKFILGKNTTTYDLEGEITSECDTTHLNNTKVEDVVSSFVGVYNQVPPMYSALKQNGVRLYELARQGIEVEREARKVNIIDITKLDVSELPYVSMKVTCGKGTYIRSLCYDIGAKLEVGATMVELKRCSTAMFNEEDSINIDDLSEENIQDNIITIEEALKTYPNLVVNSDFTKLLINGVKVFDKRLTNNERKIGVLYRVYDDKGVFIGLGRQDNKGFKIVKLLL